MKTSLFLIPAQYLSRNETLIDVSIFISTICLGECILDDSRLVPHGLSNTPNIPFDVIHAFCSSEISHATLQHVVASSVWFIKIKTVGWLDIDIGINVVFFFNLL